MSIDQETMFLTRVLQADAVGGRLFFGKVAWQWWKENKSRFPEAGDPDDRSPDGYYGDVPLVFSEEIPEGDFSVRSMTVGVTKHAQPSPQPLDESERPSGLKGTLPTRPSPPTQHPHKYQVPSLRSPQPVG